MPGTVPAAGVHGWRLLVAHVCMPPPLAAVHTVPECVLLDKRLPDKEFYGQIILGKAEFSKVKV